MRPTSLRVATACAVALAALATTMPAAHAKDHFPGIIRGELVLDYDAPCRLCHIQGTTGAGSVSTPFGNSMLAHGLTGDEATVVPALRALEADGTDSDGDGKTDVAELRAGTDPNTPVDVPLVSNDPKYGCSAAGAAPASALAGGALAALVLASARRRRRRNGRELS